MNAGPAGPALLAHHLGERRDRRGAAGGSRGQALEQREPVGDQDAARGGRRVREHLVAAKAHADGPPPDHPVGGEVLVGQLAAAVPDRRDDRPGEVAARERRGALRGDQLERLGEVGEPERRPRRRGASRSGCCRPGGPRRLKRMIGSSSPWMCACGPGQLDAAPRQLDRRREQLTPGEPPVGAVRRLEPGDRSRDGDARRADQERLRRLAVAAEADVDRRHRAPAPAPEPDPRRGDEEVGEPGGPVAAGGRA